MKTRKSIGASVLLTLFFNFFGLLYSSLAAFLVVGGLWLAGAYLVWSSTGSLARSADCLRELDLAGAEDIAMWRDCSESLEEIGNWQGISARLARVDRVDGVSGERTTEYPVGWTTVRWAAGTLVWSFITGIIALFTGVFTARRHNRRVAEKQKPAAGMREVVHHETIIGNE